MTTTTLTPDQLAAPAVSPTTELDRVALMSAATAATVHGHWVQPLTTRLILGS